MNEKLKTVALVGSVLILFVALFVAFDRPQVAQGSVQFANEYMSTTTPITTVASGKPILLKEGQGSLGSVVITGAGAGSIFLYNATTTNITKRAASMGTSTITLASFPVSTAAGTYTFDVVFTNGLVLEVLGTSPTTTITWR